MSKKITWDDKLFIILTLILIIPIGFNPIYTQIFIMILSLYVLKKTFLIKENNKGWRVGGLLASLIILAFAIVNIYRISMGTY